MVKLKADASAGRLLMCFITKSCSFGNIVSDIVMDGNLMPLLKYTDKMMKSHIVCSSQ